MKKRIGMLMLLLTAGTCPAGEWMQQYEKAYYLETAKGRPQDAAALYKAIANTDPTEENREAIKKSLLRLMHIGTVRGHEPTIRDCQEKLLSKTNTSVQELVDGAKENTTIYIPAGTFDGTITLDKAITLHGAGRESTILTAVADTPLIHVSPKSEVMIEGLSLKSQLATSERTDPPGCALLVEDAKVTVRNCAVVALGNVKRCPVGVFVQGFAEVQLLESTFNGYEYPILYGEGSEGLVKGCIVREPGHCGFMSHAESEVTLTKNIFAGSAYHGVRSTGGTIHLNNNLIIANRNRGVYLGNKTTHGEISNNAIIENGSGISVFASSDVEIENNVILDNGFSGIDTRSYGRIEVEDNIIGGNKKTGFAVYEEGGTRFRIGDNTFFNNEVQSTDYELPSSTIEEDPEFAAAEDGDFTVGNKTVRSENHGLTDPAVIAGLWKKYEEIR